MYIQYAIALPPSTTHPKWAEQNKSLSPETQFGIKWDAKLYMHALMVYTYQMTNPLMLSVSQSVCPSTLGLEHKDQPTCTVTKMKR